MHSTEPYSWHDRPVRFLPFPITWEHLLIALLLALAVFSRFYILGERVMSHDEVNHVVPSFDLYQGRGYRHDPVTHGPFQFHVVALSYFLLGDSDFTSRVPAALFSIATVAFAWWGFRRYLGKTGGLLAALFFLISPYILFYGRYTRNETFIGLYAVVMLWAMLRYLEEGRPRHLLLFVLTVAMHFITKETAFIYTAQALVFLGLLFLWRLLRRPWPRPALLHPFLGALLLAGLLVGGGLVSHRLLAPPEAAGTATPTVTVEAPAAVPTPTPQPLLPLALIAAGLLAGVGAVALAARGVGADRLRQDRPFSLLLVTLTLVLPQLAPFPVKWMGYNPLDYAWPGLLPTAVTVIVLTIAAIAAGLWWNRALWLSSAALFYGLFLVFFTTLFTNGVGFLTGLVGSLGYWLNQQAVNRGEQPLYYYALVQIPMYEYLPALGAILAFFLAWRSRLFSFPLPAEGARVSEDPAPIIMEDGLVVAPGSPLAEALPEGAADRPAHPTYADRLPVLALLLFWSFTSLIAFSIAGEKMPWLTFHIAIPMILCAAWSFGRLLDGFAWRRLGERSGWLALLLAPAFVLALTGLLRSLLGTTPPFQGSTLDQLTATGGFFFSLVAVLAFGWGIWRVLRAWRPAELLRLAGAAALALLVALTARAAIRANYINYDNAKEFLVYAHAASGPKDVLEQVEEISRRLTGGMDLEVAYDNDVRYPYWWYMRHFPNKFDFDKNPTRELRDKPVVVVGEASYGKVEPILAENFTAFDTTRMWWPMQDYFNLTWDRLRFALTDQAYRAALFDIWLNADYTRYAELAGRQDLTLTNWQPSNRMRMYVRKDVVSQIWNYGVAASPLPLQTDPYEGGMQTPAAERVIGTIGAEPGQFNAPRGLAMAPDGSLYVADSRNHRIQQLSPNGEVLRAWGTFADLSQGQAPGGTFNEPWGVAVGPDGSVYVTDTWNHRVQKFTAAGDFVTMWGRFGQAESADAFWGPRGIAVDAQNRVYVVDTGNKRVVVFTADGQAVTEFGGVGFAPGQFDEPVGIAIDQASGTVYVADTWNQRMQALAPDASGTTFLPVAQWDISGWYGQLVDNKPFTAVGPEGRVYVTDPEGARVLVFQGDGTFLYGWGDFGAGPQAFGLAAAVAVDDEGGAWVSDAGNHRLMYFAPLSPP